MSDIINTLRDGQRILDEHNAKGEHVTMSEISRALGKYSTWIAYLSRQGMPEAIDLRQRIEAHNADLNSRSRWNRRLDRSRYHLFRNSPRNQHERDRNHG